MKKIRLNNLTVESFVTTKAQDQIRGGITGTLGCYTQYLGCSALTAEPMTCKEP
jgi:hypothetical protein